MNWTCRKQDCVSGSSTEAEIIALSAYREAVWLKKLLEFFDEKQDKATIIFEDNQS